MSKVLAVALLDCRRLGFGLASGALVAGLIPALASGLGSKDGSGAGILVVAFAVVGIAAGATFGSDFNDGKSSFFFARPLSAGVLIAGRFAALLALAGGVFVSFMAVSWLASNARTGWTLSVLKRSHAEALGAGWALSLFVSLAAAARGRALGSEGGIRAMAMIPIRLGLHLGAFLLMFGLFADLVLRAYQNDFTPIRLFIGSWVVASLVASCVAIAWGRTDRLRIGRLQGRVMTAHFALVSVFVVAAWTYILHPGPEAIEGIGHASWGSPDGRLAFVHANVNRGDGRTFKPVFVLDVSAGQALRLNSDAYQGPWTSADGGTLVWSEATPFFFRPLWRAMGGATTFRVKTASGEIAPLPMPAKLPDYRTVRDLSNFGAVDQILPSPDGDVFAIIWDRHLSFTSRSRGELAEANLGSDRPWVRNPTFLPSGDLRAALSRRDASGATRLEFVDIHPHSGKVKTVAAEPIENQARVQFDGTAGRALLTSVTLPGRGASISLVDLSGAAGGARPTVLLSNVFFPNAIFLADGRIAATSGGSAGAWNKRILRIFSPTGQMVLDIALGDGSTPSLGSEMFPGILAVGTGTLFTQELSLIDVVSGAVVRRIPDIFSSGWSFSPPPPPGTPAARLLQTRDGRLYELPSPAGEPRPLLPLPAR